MTDRCPSRAAIRFGVTALTVAAIVTLSTKAGEAQDDLPARQFQTGQTFAAAGQYEEALADFEAVVALYPTSVVADNALLEIARHYLETAEDFDLAAEYAGRVVGDASYAQTDAAAEAYVFLARVAIARGHTTDNLEAALGELQRGLGLWPSAEIVPQSLFFTGEAHRYAGQLEEALAAYGRVAAEYPETVWAARAGLGAGLLRARIGDPVAAMAELQHVRDQWPDSQEARTALQRITVLYRLYIRSPEHAYGLDGEPFSTQRSPRVEELVVDQQGRVFYATGSGIGTLDPDAAADAPSGGRPRGLLLDRQGVVTAIVGGSLTAKDVAPIQLAIPRPGDRPKELRDIDAAGVTGDGDWLVMDGDEREIHRFSPSGDYRSMFVPVRAKRLAVGPNDHIAVIAGNNEIRLFAEGRSLGEIPRQGPNYKIDDPVDLAFDAIGHLYVADEKGVYVFGLDQALMMRVPSSETVPGAPRKITAFALDQFGRIVVADDDGKQILQYQ
jgi:tetratricopeptide (TPR) repeat protein